MKALNNLINVYELYINNFSLCVDSFIRPTRTPSNEPQIVYNVHPDNVSEELYWSNFNNLIKFRKLLINKTWSEAVAFFNELSLPSKQKPLISQVLNHYIDNPSLEYDHSFDFIYRPQINNSDTSIEELHAIQVAFKKLETFISESQSHLLDTINNSNSSICGDDIQNIVEKLIVENKSNNLDKEQVEKFIQTEFTSVHELMRTEIDSKINNPISQLLENLQIHKQYISSMNNVTKSQVSINENLLNDTKNTLVELHKSFVPALKKQAQEIIKNEFSSLIKAAGESYNRSINGWKKFAVIGLITVIGAISITSYLTTKILLAKVNVVNIVKPDDYKKLK